MFEIRVDDNILLQVPRQDQAGELFALVKDNYERLHEWMTWCNEDYSLASAAEFIDSAQAVSEQDAGLALIIIVDGKIAGGIGVHNVSLQDRSAESGYWIGEKYAGKGIVTRSANELLDHAFNVMQMNRMAIKCAPENLRSRAVAERLGFVLEGTKREASRLHDRFVDHVVYSMLAKEWKGK